MHLSIDILRDVQKETEAHKLWSRLEEICTAKTVTRRNLAKQRLFGLRMVEGTSLESHLANFKDIMAELDALDANTLVEEDLCSLLLMSLPPSFWGFRDILFYGSQSLSLETIYEDLSSKESMSKFSETATPSQGEGLVVRGRKFEKKSNTSRRRSKSRHPDKTCNYCKKPGHIKSECYKLQNKLKREATGSNQPSTSDQPSTNVTHNSGEILAIIDCESKLSREWILDSACSFHVFYNRESFCSFSSLSSGVVLMGNDSPCNVKGIGNVTFRMFDGRIRTLSNVRYVPDLKEEYHLS